MNVFMGYNPLATKQAKVTVWVCEQDGETPVAPSNPSEGDCFVVYATDEAVLSNTPTSAKSYSNGEWIDAEGGGGDFTTAEVQVTLAGSDLSLYVPFASDGDSARSASGIYQSGTYQAILYKGKAFAEAYGDNVSITATGDAEVGDYVVTITGNCSITLSSN